MVLRSLVVAREQHLGDPHLAWFRNWLVDAGVRCDLCEVADVEKRLASGSYDTVVVFGGLSLLRHTLSVSAPTPVLFIGQVNRSEGVDALKLGAADFIITPVLPAELRLRLQMIVESRARYGDGQASDPRVVRVGELTFDPEALNVCVGQVRVGLTRSEAIILSVLGRSVGRAVTRKHIFSCLYPTHVDVDPKIIDVFMWKLRAKLRVAGAPNLIGTAWGRGYMLRDPATVEPPVYAHTCAAMMEPTGA